MKICKQSQKSISKYYNCFPEILQQVTQNNIENTVICISILIIMKMLSFNFILKIAAFQLLCLVDSAYSS